MPIIDPDRLLEAVQESTFGMENIGFCIECGEEHNGCEPDAERYPCDDCGKESVYGAMQLLIMGYA
jgi:hypothetical protein